jgi:hypothetical protein
MSHVLRSTSQISNLIPNAQGDNLVMSTNPTATDALIAFVIGMRDFDPFANATTGLGQGTAIADREADPVVTDNHGGDTFVQRQSLRMVDLNVSNVATWNLDGYFPSLYMFEVNSAAGGATTINVNSMYTNANDSSDADDWSDRPIFDGGVDVIALNYATSTYASSTAITGATDPVVTGALSITSGNLVLALVVMKSGNAIGNVYIEKSDGTHKQVLTVLATGKCVGTEAHWVLVGDAAAYADQNILKVDNPLQYELSFLASVWS